MAAIEKDMPELTEEAVKWRKLALTLQEARSAFEDLSPEEMDTLIREAARGNTKRGKPFHISDDEHTQALSQQIDG